MTFYILISENVSCVCDKGRRKRKRKRIPGSLMTSVMTQAQPRPAMAHGPATATIRDRLMVSQEVVGLHGHTPTRPPWGALLLLTTLHTVD